MKKILVLPFLLTILTTFALSLVWEFALEPLLEGDEETFKHHLEYIVTSNVFVLIALIIPAMLSHKLEIRRRKADELLRESEGRYRMCFEQAADGIFTVDKNGNFLNANCAGLKMLGYAKDELLPLNLRELIPEEDRATNPLRLGEIMSGSAITHERRITRKGGTVIPVEACAKLLPDGSIQSIVRDITERKKAEETIRNLVADLEAQKEEMAYLANYDSLTGLPNRKFLHTILYHYLTRNRRNVNSMVILYLDLDGFKGVNDTLGHATGDLLLQGVSIRLVASLREEDTVARLGGDEFIVILEETGDSNGAIVADKIIQCLSEPFLHKDREIRIGVSIGIAVSPPDGDDVGLLIKRADRAMYAAKARGKNCWHLFSWIK